MTMYCTCVTMWWMNMVYYCCHGDHYALPSARHFPLTMLLLNLLGVGINYIILGILDGLSIRGSTVPGAWCCDSRRGSHLFQTLKMTSTQVLERSVTNNGFLRNYPHLFDHTIHTYTCTNFLMLGDTTWMWVFLFIKVLLLMWPRCPVVSIQIEVNSIHIQIRFHAISIYQKVFHKGIFPFLRSPYC